MPATNRQACGICAIIPQISDERAESFKVTLSNRDYVQVSPPTQAEFKDNVLVIITEAWQARSRPSRLIKIEPQRGSASSGRVTIKSTRAPIAKIVSGPRELNDSRHAWRTNVGCAAAMNDIAGDPGSQISRPRITATSPRSASSWRRSPRIPKLRPNSSRWATITSGAPPNGSPISSKTDKPSDHVSS
jgi:hypothetical protein